MIHLLQSALVLLFVALAIVAALRDVVSYTIPNWISLSLVAGFAAAAPAVGLDAQAVGLCVAAGAAALVLGLGMFAAGWIGGGDAKLLAACALWLGWPASLPFLAITGMAGGALAVALLGLRSPLLRPFIVTSPPWVTRMAEPGENVPYGVAIVVGALAAFPQSALMAALAH